MRTSDLEWTSLPVGEEDCGDEGEEERGEPSGGEEVGGGHTLIAPLDLHVENIGDGTAGGSEQTEANTQEVVTAGLQVLGSVRRSQLPTISSTTVSGADYGGVSGGVSGGKYEGGLHHQDVPHHWKE